MLLYHCVVLVLLFCNTQSVSVDALRNTSAIASREYKADLTPHGRPQCYAQVKSWKKDNKKLLANSQVERGKKRDMPVVAEGEARTASGMPAKVREGHATSCRQVVQVCSRFLRLLLGKAEGAVSDGVKRVSEDDANQAAATTVRWKTWLTDAK